MSQAVTMLPMDPQKKDDAFYRYKMPSIICKVEGNGNGIKTVFPNIHDVCSIIKRPESLMMKFFQFELGTQKTVSEKDDKFIVMGERSQEMMQQKVYDFITRFVLCKYCRNPETVVTVGAKDVVKLRCGACGKDSPVSVTEKCYSLFAQHFKAKAEAPKPATTDKPATEEDSSSAPKKATVQRSEEADTRPPPTDVLAEDIKADPAATDLHIRSALVLITNYGLTEVNAVRLVFRAVTMQDEEKFIGQLQQHSELLARFCLSPELRGEQAVPDAKRAQLKLMEEKLQATLIQECELRVTKSAQAFKMPILLKMLYVEGVLHQQSIEEWYNTKPEEKKESTEKAQKKSSKRSTESIELVAEMKRLSEPLLRWLEG